MRQVIKLTKTLPFPTRTPLMASWLKHPQEKKSNFYLWQSTIKRLLFFFLSRQFRYYRNKIPNHAKRILWLHLTNHSGDSLMRLSSVQLLSEFKVDLCASTPATSLLESGGLFDRVYKIQESSNVIKNQYDLIILDDLKTRTLKLKAKLFKRTPFVTVHEHFDYCRSDYNFIYYAWYRMAYLLRDIKTIEDIESKACLTMSLNEKAKLTTRKLAIPNNSIAIAIGGREKYRTYEYWDKVLKLLFDCDPSIPIVLVGSNNGLAMRAKILSRFNRAPIIDCIGKYSLMETAVIIQQCCLLVCADGGLLHIANAVGTPAVCLFAQVKPEFRCTRNMVCKAIFVEHEVNEISPHQVVDSIKTAHTVFLSNKS